MNLISAIEINRKLPNHVNQGDAFLFEHELHRKFPSVQLQILKQVTVNANGKIFKSGKICKESFRNAKFPKYASLIALQQRFINSFSKPQQLSKAIFCTDDWSNGYFHWFGDVLPRIQAFKNETGDDSPVIIPFSAYNTSFIKGSLELLNWDYILIKKGTKYLIEELYYPEYVAPTGNYNPLIMNQLRKAFFKNLKPEKCIYSDRIYISRKKAKYRKVINEAAVVDVLDSYGFQTLCFEDLSWSEQIRIATNTKILISLHGAGLTNMLFMPANSSVLELRKEGDNLNNCYFSLASALNHNYYYLGCQTTPGKTQKVDFNVALKDFQKVVQLMVESQVN